ncbi:MAG: Tetratricopeptide repeat domain protein [Candidatus Gottesmanbacteria bacterium GW2011_GWA1_42_26]|nr:MAG: Tetratricopeptide repeat domain protein [Candidatus Gottesmanbacteria bacterium GW2011_GWA1_42_26]
MLRVNLGGVFFTLKRYDEAIQQFQISVALKSDFANGYYNLAAALREKGDFAQAANAMRAVLKIVPVNSEDYKKAEKELEEIVKKVPAVPETSAGQVLQQPTNSGPKITPPLKLDQTATPEIPEETTGAAKLASPTPASPEL